MGPGGRAAGFALRAARVAPGIGCRCSAEFIPRVFAARCRFQAACLQPPGCVHHQQHVDPTSRAAGEEKRLQSRFCSREGAAQATL